uniref:Serpin-ZX n=1 Tax=Cajanus cajan TaxID=3821 RepID=A0A151TBW6_CAJCA|nr:Serpin-ZX [Cajanus cajan]
MDLRESISNQTDVALSITKPLLSKEGREKNVVFSPLSLHVVLSIIAAGSKGHTLDQLLSFLRSKSNDHLNSFASQLVAVVLSDAAPAGGPRLSFANGVWVEQSLSPLPSFKQLVTTDYKATLASVDFQTKAVEVANEVNSWAEKETNGLVKELLPPGSVDNSTRLIFANALYFKGAWNEKFDPSTTEDNDFHLLDDSTVKVPFMTSNKKQFIRAFDGFKVLGLPYKQGEDKRLTEMVDSSVGQNLCVSDIFHKSFIEVNEEGTEAAAATAATILLRSVQFPTKIDFVADHPFLFLIREDLTGTVLFIGQVLNPHAE